MIRTNNADDTAQLARKFARRLCVGDCVLLDGPVGAGKSHFVRSAILELLTEPEDVPSPTYTLVQTYDAPDFEIWHADLYRLTSPNEVDELGLLDAMETAVCFIEWPARLAGLTPKDALHISLTPFGFETERDIQFTSNSADWTMRLKDIL